LPHCTKEAAGTKKEEEEKAALLKSKEEKDNEKQDTPKKEKSKDEKKEKKDKDAQKSKDDFLASMGMKEVALSTEFPFHDAKRPFGLELDGSLVVDLAMGGDEDSAAMSAGVMKSVLLTITGSRSTATAAAEVSKNLWPSLALFRLSQHYNQWHLGAVCSPSLFWRFSMPLPGIHSLTQHPSQMMAAPFLTANGTGAKRDGQAPVCRRYFDGTEGSWTVSGVPS